MSDSKEQPGTTTGASVNRVVLARNSILSQPSCRGGDACKIWEAVLTGPRTVSQVCVTVRRGTKYVHDLLKVLESEGKLSLSDAKRVSDRLVTVKGSSR